MKKAFCTALAIVAAVLLLSGCGAEQPNNSPKAVQTLYGNKQMFDMTYNFNKVMIALPDGSVVSGKLSSWRDYENSDQIQVVVDGDTYLTHISNVVLIQDK